MNNNEILIWIIDNIKENRTLDVLKVQDLIYHRQDLAQRNTSQFSTVVPNAQRKKYENSLALSKLVVKTVNWLQSNEGTAWMSSQDLSWSNEDIGKNVFGWQKSFFYKLLKAGKLEDEVLVAFNEYCDTANRDGQKLNRSIENLLMFAKRPDTETNNEPHIGESDFEIVRKIILAEKNKSDKPEANRFADLIISRIDQLISDSN
jgi:hypothetical protein